MDKALVNRGVPVEWVDIPRRLYAENFTSNTFLLEYETHQELLHTYKLDVLEKLFSDEDQLKKYLQANVAFFEHISTSLPIPKLIYHHGAALHFVQNSAYYRAEFPGGVMKTLPELMKAHRAEIAFLLKKIHQTNVQNYIAPLFFFKNRLLAQAWEHLVLMGGLELIRQLVYKQLGLNLDALLQLVEEHLNIASMSEFSKNVVFAHADIKPKNILWENNHLSALLHWDEMCYMTAEADFMETLINWTVDKSQDSYRFNLEQAYDFREAYDLPLNIQPLDLALVIARWCFYTLFCYQQGHEAGYNEAMRMFAFLDREQGWLLHLT